MKALLLLLSASLCFAETYKDLKLKAFSERQEMSVRWKSLVRMAEMKKKESMTDLHKALNSKTWYMRNAALLAIDSIDSDKAFEAAKKQLSDPALVVRSAAVEVIAKNKTRKVEARKLLWNELADKQNKIKSKSLWIREQIAQILVQEPQASEREKFLVLVEENDPKLSGLAKAALLKMDAAQSVTRAAN